MHARADTTSDIVNNLARAILFAEKYIWREIYCANFCFYRAVAMVCLASAMPMLRRSAGLGACERPFPPGVQPHFAVSQTCVLCRDRADGQLVAARGTRACARARAQERTCALCTAQSSEYPTRSCPDQKDPRPVPRVYSLSRHDAVQHRGGFPFPAGSMRRSRLQASRHRTQSRDQAEAVTKAVI